MINLPLKRKRILEGRGPNEGKRTLDCYKGGQRSLVMKRGDAVINIQDSKGINRKVILKRALCVPSYNQVIISVNALTENNIEVFFSKENNYLRMVNGTRFDMIRQGKLFYLLGGSNIDSVRKVVSKSLKEWHHTLGHWNVADILKLESCCSGMKISSREKFQCGICIEAKMTQQINHKPDPKASEILELVHSDLSGPLRAESLQGCSYTIFFRLH